MVLEQKAGGAGAARWWGACTHTHKSEAQTSQHAQKAPSAAAAAAAEHRTPSAAQPSATARVRTRCRGQAPPLGAREFDGTRYRLAPSDELAPRDGPVAGAGAGAARRRADCPCSCAPPTGNFLGDSAIPQGLPEGISSHPTRALMARRTPPRNPSEGTLIHHATPCIAAQCTVSPIRVLRGRAKATAWWTTAAMRSRPSEICRHLLPAPYSWYNCQGIPEHSEIVLFWEKKEIGRKYPAPGPLVAMDVRRMRGVSSCNRCGRGAPAPRRGRQQGAQAASVEVCDVRGAARRGAPPSAVLPGRGPPCAAHPALPGAVRRSRGWGASARRTWHRGAARCARHPQAALARATAPAPSMPACPTRRDARPCAHSAGARARRASKQMP